jgi:hypothetical protein
MQGKRATRVDKENSMMSVGKQWGDGYGQMII